MAFTLESLKCTPKTIWKGVAKYTGVMIFPIKRAGNDWFSFSLTFVNIYISLRVLSWISHANILTAFDLKTGTIAIPGDERAIKSFANVSFVFFINSHLESIVLPSIIQAFYYTGQ